MEQLLNQVKVEQMYIYILCTIILCVILFKIYLAVAPIIKSKIDKKVSTEIHDETLESQVKSLTSDNAEIHKKLDNDYARLNNLDRLVDAQTKETQESLQERKIIISSLLALIEAMQKIAPEVAPALEQQKNEIISYMTDKSHKTEEKQ